MSRDLVSPKTLSKKLQNLELLSILVWLSDKAFSHVKTFPTRWI